MRRRTRLYATLVCIAVGCVAYAQDGQPEALALLEEQYRLAHSFESVAGAFVAATEVVLALQEVYQGNGDPSVGRVLATTMDSLLPALARKQAATIGRLIETEERLHALLGEEPGASFGAGLREHDVGLAGGALVILGMFGVGAATAEGVMAAFEECEQDYEASALPEARRLAERIACVVRRTPGAAATAVRTFVTETSWEVATALTRGTLRIVLETYQAIDAVEDIRVFARRGCDLPDGEQGVAPGSDGARLRHVADVSFPEPDLYVGRADADGVVHGVPEGAWTMVAFAPGHARAVSGCLRVRAGLATDAVLTFTPNETVVADPASAPAGLVTYVLVADEPMFEGCPGRVDIESSSTAASITFRWTSGPDEGEHVTFAWSAPFEEEGRVRLNAAVEDASFASPPGFSFTLRVDGQAQLPYLSALPNWERSATYTLPGTRDAYEVEVVWSTNSPFGYGCGNVSTVAHRYRLERR